MYMPGSDSLETPLLSYINQASARINSLLCPISSQFCLELVLWLVLLVDGHHGRAA